MFLNSFTKIYLTKRDFYDAYYDEGPDDIKIVNLMSADADGHHNYDIDKIKAILKNKGIYKDWHISQKDKKKSMLILREN